MTFITIEGCEATGKSTNVKLLAEKLRSHGYKPWCTKEPGGPNPLSQTIRQILLNPETQISPQTSLLLFLADRRANMEQIREKLDADYVVISDRGTFSSFAYYMAALGNADVLDTIAKITPLLDFAQLVQPDLTVVCSASTEWSAKQLKARKTLDRIEKLGPDFHRRVGEFFKPYHINVLQAALARPATKVHFCKPADQATAEEICDEIFVATGLPTKPNALRYLATSV